MTESFKGVAASAGVAIGIVHIYRTPSHNVTPTIVSDSEREAVRFLKAIEDAVTEIEEIKEKIAADPTIDAEHGKIIEAHRMILKDPAFADSIAEQIRSTSKNAEAVLRDKTDELVAMFETMDDEYMRQRASDIQDISGRVMAKLFGLSYGFNASESTDIILVADDLHPSDTIELDLTRVRGFATDVGGRTSHTAIMARTRGIPAVVGAQALSETAVDGMVAIVDGGSGEVHLNPTSDEISFYEAKARTDADKQRQLHQLLNEPSTTTDGFCVELAANIGVPEDAIAAMENGAEGVGLFRSEFLFMNRHELPSEEEQFEAYRRAVSTMDGRPVIIRTMDIGGDKSLEYLNLPRELNPFLGYRAIRISLDQQSLFQTQVRAILRASHYGKVKIMYPMIATLEEVRQAKAGLEAAQEELQREGIAFDAGLEQGIMIEVPAAAISAEQLAPEVDFFSIGTNDLIQYTMAADRMNEKVSYLYQPYHPAILRLIKMVIDAAHHHGKWAGMCGEMAGDIRIVPILLGLGMDELSMSPSSILEVRELVRNSNQGNLRTLAEELIQQPSSTAVQELLQRYR
ncbi:phosphoenolpyruvate--protein phosphotransferase [Alicyclobacillus sp. SO9]|nr:phosphoenolpyruvate--protein phosphotransferase [Alicyclobacillus sp. SO9]QQE81381.1 phosphoenolpyruvate--protein phosphotransferase [Alicyclobacillus sp. SO9]